MYARTTLSGDEHKLDSFTQVVHLGHHPPGGKSVRTTDHFNRFERHADLARARSRVGQGLGCRRRRLSECQIPPVSPNKFASRKGAFAAILLPATYPALSYLVVHRVHETRWQLRVSPTEHLELHIQ